MLETKRALTHLGIIVVLLLSSASVVTSQDEKKKKQLPQGERVLWREPTDIASRNLLLGPGGERMKPDLSRITFIHDDYLSIDLPPGVTADEVREKTAAHYVE